MRKENLFIFIALLPLSIQTQDHDFSLGILFELHNYERTQRGLDKLNKDIDMTNLASNLASKLIADNKYNIYEDKEINEKYKVNVFRLDNYNYDESIKLSTTTVFNQWLVQEVYTTENNEVMEYPTKIICKNTTHIGLGYEVTNEDAVVVGLYHENNLNC